MPVNLCECGCGKPTKQYTQTRIRAGIRVKKGEFARYLHGHYPRPVSNEPTKRCNTCGLDLPRNYTVFLLVRNNRLSGSCRKCRNKISILWQKNNPERAKEIAKKTKANTKPTRTAWTQKNRERVSSKARTWREANAEAFSRMVKEWGLRNPSNIRQHRQRAKLKRRAALYASNVSPVDLDFIYQRDNGICGICGDPVSRQSVTFDHIVPVTKKGNTDNDNLQPAHKNCNRVKGNRPLDWARARVTHLKAIGNWKGNDN